MDNFNWRPMRANDLDGVVAVAASAFPGHFESRACFEERLRLFPQGCFALAATDTVKGYLITYPWPLGAIPPLNSLIGKLPERRDALYLHDLALHPDMRGQGQVRPILERLVRDTRAMGIPAIALVSVNDTAAFWQAMGFQPAPDDDAIGRKLHSYGDGSVYMIREL